jgi:hypothetical protein
MLLCSKPNSSRVSWVFHRLDENRHANGNELINGSIKHGKLILEGLQAIEPGLRYTVNNIRLRLRYDGPPFPSRLSHLFISMEQAHDCMTRQ